MTQADLKLLQNANAQVADLPIGQLIANTIRFLSADGVQRANSGHPGMPMGCADLATALWTQFIRIDAADPHWINRDRFVLSAGHGSMLLYSLLHLSGFGVSMDDLRNFRQWGSPTPGHPEYGHAPGVETTTGPLGQGFANGVGMAIAAKWMGAHFNTDKFPSLISPRIFGIAGDGCMMEGISAEAASFAGHHKLDNIIYFYDDNHISIDGPTSLTFSREDVYARFEAYGWHVQRIDGQVQKAVAEAIRKALDTPGQPHLIAARTTIGFGSPNKANTAGVHGSPLGPDEVKLTKENLGWPVEPEFFVPNAVRNAFSELQHKWTGERNAWNKQLVQYKNEVPEKAALLDQILSGKIDVDWKALVDEVGGAKEATRKSSGRTLGILFDKVPNLVGGSADLTPSNNTLVKGMHDFSPENYGGRYVRFGVREHAMAAMMNGMSLFGGLRPYGGTFLVFSDYMRPSIRLAAIMGQPVVFVFTHDSVFLGEDGPTHQPIEHLAVLRAIPNLTLIRPADGATTAVAWKAALEHTSGPTALALTRQSLPAIPWDELPASPFDLEKGAYILFGDAAAKPDVLITASGSETHLALQAAQKLAADNVKVRVVDVPSWELFEKQDAAYKESVFPAALPPCLLVEAAASQGWERYLGRRFARISIDGRFGASAPAEVIAEHLGFTVENVIARAKELLG